MPDELDLINALREYQRLSGNANPFISRNPDIPNQSNVIQPLSPAVMNATSQTDNSPDYSDALMQRYMHQLDTMPVREKPGLAQKIFAGVAGITNPEAANDIMYGKYNRKLADWKLATEEIGKGASQERLYNVNKRQVSALGEKTRHEMELEDQGRAKLANAENRTAIYKFKAENPAGVIKSDNEGNLIKINPATGETTYLFNEDTGEPIKGATLPDAEKLSIQQANALEIQRAKETAAQEMERIRQKNRVTNIGLQGQESRETKETIPGANPIAHPNSQAKPETPAQKATRWRNNANRFKAEYPKLAQYVTVDGNNVSIAAPSSGSFFSKGPDAKDYEMMKKYIFDVENQAPSGDIALTPETAPAGKQEAIPEEPKITAKEPSSEPTKEPKVISKLDPKTVATAKASLKPGYVLVTNGKDIGQVPKAQVGNMKEPGWYEVK